LPRQRLKRLKTGGKLRITPLDGLFLGSRAPFRRLQEGFLFPIHKDGLPYQTWINRLLRQNVLTEGDSIEARLAKAEARVEKLEQMIREIQSEKAA